MAKTYWRHAETAADALVVGAEAAPESGHRHFVQGFSVVLGTADGTNEVLIEITDGSTTYYHEIIAAAATKGTRLGVVFGVPGFAMPNEALVQLEISDPGGTTVIFGNLWGYSSGA